MSDLSLRAATEADYKWLFAWSLEDHYVGRRFGHVPSCSQFAAHHAALVSRHWVIEDGQGRPVGQGLLYNMHLELGVAQVAVDLLPSRRGRDHAQEILGILREDGFATLPLRKLYVHRLLSGPYDTSRNPWLADPFVFEGFLPRHEVVFGKFCDLAVWATFVD